MYGTNLFGIGVPELFFIAILALIVLGPQRLPGVIREIGKFIRQVRSITSELTSQFSEELALLDEINPQKIFTELIEDPEEDKKEKESAKKSTSKNTTKPAAKDAITSTGSTTKKVAKPAAGSKPALGATNTAEKPAETDEAVPDAEADTEAEKIADNSDEEAANLEAADEQSVEEQSTDIIEEAEAVAAKVDMTEIENRIAPPSMSGAAQALRGKSTGGKSTAKKTPKAADEAIAVKEDATDQSVENALGESIAAAKPDETVDNELDAKVDGAELNDTELNDTETDEVA